MLILSLTCMDTRDVYTSSPWQPYGWMAQELSCQIGCQLIIACLGCSFRSCHKFWKVLSSIFSGGLACPTGCGFTGPNSWQPVVGGNYCCWAWAEEEVEIQRFSHQTSSQPDMDVLFEHEKDVKYFWGLGSLGPNDPDLKNILIGQWQFMFDKIHIISNMIPSQMEV